MLQVPSMQQFEAQQAQLQKLQADLAALQYHSGEMLSRTYHLGAVVTAGRAYDDRLTIRMGFGKTKLRELLDLGPKRGGLRHRRAGDKYIVTEAAIREWCGDPLPKLPTD